MNLRPHPLRLDGLDRRGFTLIEVVVIMGIVSLLFVAAFSLGRLDQRQKFDSDVQQTLIELRTAQAQARNVSGNQEYGMTFAGDRVTSFTREPASGTQTETGSRQLVAGTLSWAVNPTASQIVFERLTGNPKGGATATLTFTANDGGLTSLIKVESNGRIYVQ